MQESTLRLPRADHHPVARTSSKGACSVERDHSVGETVLGAPLLHS